MMKLLTAVICFAALCLALSASAAEDSVSFSGTWILDSKESDAAPRPIVNLGAPGESGMGGGMGGMGGGMGGMGGGMGGGPMGGGGGMGGGPMGGGGGFPGRKAPQPTGEPAPMVIQQTENEIQITNIIKGMEGKDMPMVENFKLDGKELVEMIQVPNSPKPVKKTTQVTLKKNKLQVKQKIESPQGNSNETKKDYSLSKDGSQLTLNIKTTTVMPIPNMVAMVSQTEQKLVYNKK